ncbi:MAG TPA: PPC domain-containing protein [Blastocatellia bacterium]|nr:PPC domain-containing protein [Blastocatellia bacterium]
MSLFTSLGRLGRYMVPGLIKGTLPRRLAISTVLLFCTMGANDISPSTQPIIQLGQTVEGELGPGDKKLDDGTYYDLYLFRGESRQRIVLDLTSSDFDPFLTLLDQDGMAIVSDHASGGQRHARITLSLPYSGRYYIRVNTVHKEQRGKYTLRTTVTKNED